MKCANLNTSISLATLVIARLAQAVWKRARFTVTLKKKRRKILMHEDVFKMTKVKEHYEVYRNGEFFCSADNVVEAAKEIDNAKDGNE